MEPAWVIRNSGGGEEKTNQIDLRTEGGLDADRVPSTGGEAVFVNLPSLAPLSI